MQQFDVEIQISASDQEELSGRIKMFDGGNTIQDDPITGIEFKNIDYSKTIPVCMVKVGTSTRIFPSAVLNAKGFFPGI